MRRYRREIALCVALALLLVYVAVAAPDFFGAGNLRNLVIDNLPVLVLATAMTLVLLAGQIDISVGSQFAVCGVVAGVLAKAGAPVALVIPLTLVAGTLMGAVNGWLVARLEIPPIIVTLAAMVGIRGALRWVTGGEWVQDLPESFQWFGLSQSAGQWVFLFAALGCFAAGCVFLRWTTFGRAFPATGCDSATARLVGVRAKRVIFAAFAVMGAFAALAALVNFPRYPSIEIEAGLGIELQVIACVVVGGTSVTGGRGTLLGTLLGVALLCTLGNVLVFLRVDAAWERAIQGVIILAAVTIDTATARSLRRGVHHA